MKKFNAIRIACALVSGLGALAITFSLQYPQLRRFDFDGLTTCGLALACVLLFDERWSWRGLLVSAAIGYAIGVSSYLVVSSYAPETSIGTGYSTVGYLREILLFLPLFCMTFLQGILQYSIFVNLLRMLNRRGHATD